MNWHFLSFFQPRAPHVLAYWNRVDNPAKPGSKYLYRMLQCLAFLVLPFGSRQSLFNEGGFNLIAYQRPKNSDDTYVDTLKSWVRRLLDAGVKPSRITLVGFSRGAQLTALASSDLASVGINTALLAICEDGDVSQTPGLVLGGNLLSIYESSDELGSCGKLAARSPLKSFKEVPISTGKKHGAFFQPLPQWLRPLEVWIAKTNR